ncbi:MAG TPA: hypothetical protein VM143_13715 [Acidimicrobiales bacterium]|nr:hypothetical protein [Acidimicrobiales bacterium]
MLNRATGQCVVCADHGGTAPPPVATREAASGADDAQSPEPSSSPPGPPSAPPVVPRPDQPISVSAAVAILDLSDRPDKVARSVSAPTPLEAEPPLPTPRVPGAPIGVIRAARVGGRRKVDVVAYDGNLVLAKRGAPSNVTSSQLAGQDASSRILTAEAVEEAIVREDAISGQARMRLRNGDTIVVRWPGWKNRSHSAENLLAHAFPGKVDQGSPEIAKRTVRVMVGLGVGILLAVVAFLGLSALLQGDPPPPPPPTPPTTLPAAEQAARTALQQACPSWQQFAGSVATGERPVPTAMRPVVDGIRPWFVAAADAGADPLYAAARDEVGYLQEYARRPVDDVARESISRVAFAIRTVSSACARANPGSPS